jgi:alkylation response protein AidB-like acyl-CoA dehydrogenase
MDLLPSAEQDEIVGVVAGFLRTELPIQSIRERRNEPTPVDPATWAKCGDLGWFGLGLSESLGGVGYGMAEEVMLFRELGRHLASGPFIGSVLGARIAALAGAVELCALILSGAASVGIAERRSGDDVVGSTVSGSFDLIDAVGASHVLVYAGNGNGVALVEAAALGSPESLHCIDPGVRLSRVELVSVPVIARVSGNDADAIVLRGTALVAAMLTGIAEATGVMSAEYAKVREQFGKPIGVNQAVKHVCADMATRSEAATSQLFFAAASIDDARADAAFQVEAARIIASDAAIENATHSIQVHGGMGYTFEHDANLFLKRARVLDRIFGENSHHLATLISLPSAE